MMVAANSMFQRTFTLLKTFKFVSLFAVMFCMGIANAGPLNISNVPLELTPAIPPNVLILTDDSGSMDWEVLTQDPVTGGAYSAANLDGTGGIASINHRTTLGGPRPTCEFYVDPSMVTASGDFTGGYLYIVAFKNNVFTPKDSDTINDPFIRNCFVAPDDDFRARNSKFNPLYFDPNKKYIPWAGVDIDGTAYPDADITNAPENPYDPMNVNTEHIDLTTQQPGFDTSGNRITGEGFKYYDWDDLNSDGIFDAGEETQNLIRDQDAATQQNFANWFTYYRKREYVAKALASHAAQGRNSTYIDHATINRNSVSEFRIDRTDLPFDEDANQLGILDAITRSNSTSTNTTPLKTALDQAGNYFQCDANDIFNSSGSTSAGNSNCPLLADPAAECQINSTFIFTDGFNNETGPTIGDEDDNLSAGNFDGGAFEDGVPDTLADIAMFYYENDLSSSDDNVPVTSVDFNRDPNVPEDLEPGDTLHQHMKTNTVGIFNNFNSFIDTSFPSDATVLNVSFWDTTSGLFEDKIDDLVHAAYNGRGNFIPASGERDFPAVMAELNTSFSRAASNFGSTTAVAFNTQSITADSVVFRTFSNLATNSGELVAQQVNPNGSFAVNPDGTPVFLWSAATELDALSPSSRTILTYEASDTEGREFVITGTPATTGLSAVQQTALALSPTPPPATPVNPVVPTRVDYLRGNTSEEGSNYDLGEMRERVQSTTTEGITTGAILGDIVHSSPVFVGEPPFANRVGGAFPGGTNSYSLFRVANQSREEIVYVGANDGMLHAFQVTDGVEKFAYVPDELLDEIGNYTSPDYVHQFFVDATPSVNDVFIDPVTGGSQAWRTVLIGGLGAGGKGYYALDITEPNSIDENDVMWEFTNNDDPDLGFTYSVPVIGMSNAPSSGNKDWVAIFGNGYNSGSASGNAVIYIAFIDEGYNGWAIGSDVIKIDTGNGTAESADGMTPNGIGGVTGIDTDGDGTIDRVYAGDLQGNVYIVDMSSTNDSSWDLTSNPLFIATYEEGAPATSTLQPITTKPTVVLGPNGVGYIVIVGTGSYFTTDDGITADIQSIYGLWDNPADPSTISKYSPSELIEQEFITTVDSDTGLVVRTVTTEIVDYTLPTPPRGWFIDFDIPPPGSSSGVQFPGERPVRNLQLRNNQLFFSTVIPQDGSSCAPPAGGFGLSVDPLTGSVGTDVIFDVNIDGLFDENDNLNNVNDSLNIIVGTQFESSPGDSTFIGDYRVTQLSNTNVDRILVNPDLNSGGATGALLGRHSWKEIRN